jgi:hypothetical protein
MRTNIQKMVAAEVCDICREEIENDGPHEASYQSPTICFDYNSQHMDFHKACLVDYKFPDPHAEEATK